MQRVEHVLPRAERVRRADLHRLAGQRGADEVGHEPAGGLVAAADHVAGAHARHAASPIESRNAAITSSCAAFELEYGS